MVKFKQLIKQWLIPPDVLQLLVRMRDGQKSPVLSPEDKELLMKNERLKDRHQGSRCFILGAGSSIKKQDITKLEGEFVISVSNTFVHPDFSRIKPRYHVLPPLIKNHGKLHSEEKYSIWLREMEAAIGDAEMFLHIGDRGMIERNGLFKDRIIHWVEYADWDGDFSAPINLMSVPHIGSVSELALTVAVYLGFDNIYLIGMDHDWFNGVLVYFYDYTKEHAMRPDLKNLGFADSEFQMRRHANIFRKYKYLYASRKNIYNANANPKHYMDVFPKVEYDALFIDSPKRDAI